MPLQRDPGRKSTQNIPKETEESTREGGNGRETPLSRRGSGKGLVYIYRKDMGSETEDWAIRHTRPIEQSESVDGTLLHEEGKTRSGLIKNAVNPVFWCGKGGKRARGTKIGEKEKGGRPKEVWRALLPAEAHRETTAFSGPVMMSYAGNQKMHICTCTALVRQAPGVCTTLIIVKRGVVVKGCPDARKKGQTGDLAVFKRDGAGLPG